jgi:hypothetical protein
LNEEGATERFKIVENKDKEPIGIDNTRLLTVVVLGASGLFTHSLSLSFCLMAR